MAPSNQDIATLLTDASMRGALATMLLAAANGPVQGEVNVKRDGDVILIPDTMSLQEAKVWIQRQIESEEKVVAINHTITCFPLDGLVAIWAAFKETFGFTELGTTSGPWGPEPPMLMRVDISATEFVQVPYCELKPPKWEGGFIEPKVAGYNKLVIIGKVQKKHEASVKKLLERAEAIVRANSIYKGKAISLDLSWVEDLAQGNIRFDPTKHRPHYLSLQHVKKDMLILNNETQQALDGSVFLRIERPDVCRSHNIQIKHGVLCQGTYGTGKSTTGMVVGAVAERNGYTFMYCKTPEQLVVALELSRMLAPTVLFCEDIDPILDEEREADMNALLEGMDGIEAKGKDVICIFTTNFATRINPAFMRPGRIDTLLTFDLPSTEVAARFVKEYTTGPDGLSYLTEDADMVAIGDATAGNVPVVIGEIVQAAKCAALMQHGDNITGKVSTTHIVNAANYKKAHIAMTHDKNTSTMGAALAEAHAVINKAAEGELDVTATYHGLLKL